MILMRMRSGRGSVLIVAMIFVLAFAIAAGSVLALALSSYRLTMRNETRAQARAVAESELESIFYQFRDLTIAQGVDASNVPEKLADAGIAVNALYPYDPTQATPPAPLTPFLQSQKQAGWRVWRSSTIPFPAVQGWMPADQMSTYGTSTTVDVKIEVRPPVGTIFADDVVVRVGRQISVAAYSIFQHAVFYQGDLELYASKNVTINGDVVANGNIYMSSTPSAQLVLTGKVCYLGGDYFDTNAGGTPVLTKPGIMQTDQAGDLSALPSILDTNPLFDPSPVWSGIQDVSDLANAVASDPTADAGAEAAQLQTMENPENLLGGANATVIQANDPSLFPDINSVYRAAIVPPPDAPAVVSTVASQPVGAVGEYPSGVSGLTDDPTISAQRMYNRAGLMIQVNPDGTTVILVPSDPNNLQSGYVAAPSAFNDIFTETYTDPVTGNPTVIKPVYDEREQTNVGITTIDIGKLNTALQNYPGTLSAFNGVVYVWLVAGSSTNPSALRLENGATLPFSGPNQSTGLSVATNGGIYIKGDYNLAPLPSTATKSDGTSVAGDMNPAMLMGDAITLLSGSWSDDNANALLSSGLRNANPNNSTTTQTINSGLLTGNTSNVKHNL